MFKYQYLFVFRRKYQKKKKKKKTRMKCRRKKQKKKSIKKVKRKRIAADRRNNDYTVYTTESLFCFCDLYLGIFYRYLYKL